MVHENIAYDPTTIIQREGEDISSTSEQETKIYAALHRFTLSSSMIPSAWRIYFMNKKAKIYCNIHLYFKNQKIVRAKAAGADEESALHSCLSKIATVPKSRSLPENYTLLGS